MDAEEDILIVESSSSEGGGLLSTRESYFTVLFLLYFASASCILFSSHSALDRPLILLTTNLLHHANTTICPFSSYRFLFLRSVFGFCHFLFFLYLMPTASHKHLLKNKGIQLNLFLILVIHLDPFCILDYISRFLVSSGYGLLTCHMVTSIICTITVLSLVMSELQAAYRVWSPSSVCSREVY